MNVIGLVITLDKPQTCSMCSRPIAEHSVAVLNPQTGKVYCFRRPSHHDTPATGASSSKNGQRMAAQAKKRPGATRVSERRTQSAINSRVTAESGAGVAGENG